MIRGWLKPLWHDSQGQALIEFTLIAPLLLLFLFAIIQMGLLFNAFISIEQAARIGVREASLDQSSQVACSIYHQLNTGIFPKTATVNWSESVSNGTSSSSSSNTLPTVQVDVSTQYPLMIPLPGLGSSIAIGQKYTMVQEIPSSSTTTLSGSFTIQNPPC